MSGYCMNCMEPIGEDRPCACGFDGARPSPRMAHHLPPGTVLSKGRYIVGRALGQGGFGITYIGRDLTLNMRVAIKEYYPAPYVNRPADSINRIVALDAKAQARIESGRRRFLDEARVLAKFHNNPGIVDVRDFFEENATAYIVMDYLEGETLKSHLQRGPIDADEVFDLMTPILDALELVHSENVIHRDITPDNIMLCSNGDLCLMDFGAAQEMDYADQRSVSMVLKSGYAPEEQYRAKGELGPWTDIYALCATMYRAITGIAPDESLQRLISDEMAWPSEMGLTISPAQEHVLKKGMAPRSANRYQSIAEMKRDLAAAEADQAPAGEPWKTKSAAPASASATAPVAKTAIAPGEYRQVGPGTSVSHQANGLAADSAAAEEGGPRQPAIPSKSTQATKTSAPDQAAKSRRPKRGKVIAVAAACALVALALLFLLSPAHTVSFDATGGSAVDPVTVNRIGSVPEPEPPTRSGYEFAGWYLDESLVDAAEFPLAPGSDTTLYAAWNKTLASYRVDYLDAIDGTPVADAKVVDYAKVGSKVTEKAPGIDGYALDSKKKVRLTISEDDAANVATFKYRKLVSYTVSYRDRNTNADVAPAKTVDDAAQGTEATETAIEVAGYTLQSENTQTIKLDGDSEKNTIVFEYTPIPVYTETSSSYDGGSSSRRSGSNDVNWAN